MNKINSIYATASKEDGQIYIAADTQYLGKVGSYNNYFTQFFAWAFDRSMTVNFDGKIHVVNKEDYTQLVSSFFNNEKIDNIRERSMFRSVVEEASTLPKNEIKMRHVLPKTDQDELFKKLAKAIWKGETQTALQAIGEGAELETAYYDREYLQPSFTQDEEGLARLQHYSFWVSYATPLLQAAIRGNLAVCKFLKEAGANLDVKGDQYLFEREILSIEKSSHFGLAESETITTQDSISEKTEYQIADKETFDLAEIVSDVAAS